MTPTICWHGYPEAPRKHRWRCRLDHRNDVQFSYGRCRSGGRWFWAAGSWHSDDDERAGARAHGWEDTEQAALDAAQAFIIADATARDRNSVAYFSAGYASLALKKLNAAKRAAKPPSNSTDSKSTEYLYGYFGYCDDMTSEWVVSFYRFQVVKKTAKRIYYLATKEHIDELTGEPDRESFRDEGRIGFVDRLTLEADGVVTNRGRHWSASDHRLYPSLRALRDYIHRNDGKEEVVDVATLKQAMADAHPDRGGTSAAFIAARQKYVDARRRARSSSRRAP